MSSKPGFMRCEFGENKVSLAVRVKYDHLQKDRDPLPTQDGHLSCRSFREIQANASAFLFSLCDLEDERKARMGIVEAAKHQTVLPYDVIYERKGALVVQYLTTLFVIKGNVMVTHPRFDAVNVQTEKPVRDEEIVKLFVSEWEEGKTGKRQLDLFV